MKIIYRIELSNLDVINAAYTAISIHMREKRNLYLQCKHNKPYYPLECERIAKEIEELDQILISFQNYELCICEKEDEQ